MTHKVRVSKASHRDRSEWFTRGQDQREEKAMRELILILVVSPDSGVSGTEGEVEWVVNGDQKAVAWKVRRGGTSSYASWATRVAKHGLGQRS